MAELPVAFAMKAAMASGTQLRDRARRLMQLGLPVVLELHTFGGRDLADDRERRACLDRVRRLGEHGAARLIAHVPPQEPAVVSCQEFDGEQVRRTVDFAHAVSADGIVVHRYLRLRRDGVGSPLGREEEGERFVELLAAAIRDSGQLTVHVENLGFFWLRPRRARKFLVSALDHFFPWEQDAFVRSAVRHGLTNVRPMFDLAHAAISANMFNLRRRYPERFADDARFSNIDAADLEHAPRLGALDFLHPSAIHIHCSDAFEAADSEAIPASAPSAAMLWRWLTGEGLPLGSGNLDFKVLMTRLSRDRDRHVTLVPEIRSGPEQERAIRVLGKLARRRVEPHGAL